MRAWLPMLLLLALTARPAAALELIGVFDGNDFFSQCNDRCTVCEIVGDDEMFLLAKLEGEGDDSSDLFDLIFDDDKSGTWSRTDDAEDPTHLAVKAGPMFALYEITDADGDVWTTEALRNRGGQQPGLSHLSFYVSPGIVVPEVGGWALLLVAGLGLAVRRARST